MNWVKSIGEDSTPSHIQALMPKRAHLKKQQHCSQSGKLGLSTPYDCKKPKNNPGSSLSISRYRGYFSLSLFLPSSP
jgi:hypothetical protein